MYFNCNEQFSIRGSKVELLKQTSTLINKTSVWVVSTGSGITIFYVFPWVSLIDMKMSRVICTVCRRVSIVFLPSLHEAENVSSNKNLPTHLFYSTFPYFVGQNSELCRYSPTSLLQGRVKIKQCKKFALDLNIWQLGSRVDLKRIIIQSQIKLEQKNYAVEFTSKKILNFSHVIQ